ncbi:MAG: CpsD/CapB family tyrosine-protein kinase [Planctomycetia bacterium]|nr:CpsD/CapB family tyrosine-protein kinase [Planctomycetia bacterium]
MSTATHPTATLRESTPANVPLPRTGNDYFTTLLRRLRAPHNGSGVPQIIGILGCERGVGVSTIAANLAIEAAAASDANVLLIDANPRHATLGPAFRIAAGPGWTEMLSGSETPDQCVQATQIERLSLLPAGREVVSGSELANMSGSTHLVDSLHTLRQQYGLVIVDLPSADELHSVLENSVLENSVLGLLRKLDGVVLVIEAEKTRGEAAQRIKQQLLDAGAHVLGAVLNKRRS